MLNCMFCATTVDRDLDYREQIGFTRKRSTGGANQLVFPRNTGNWACRGCVDMARKGIHPQQMTMEV